jgi:hypothetical protein
MCLLPYVAPRYSGGLRGPRYRRSKLREDRASTNARAFVMLDLPGQLDPFVDRRLSHPLGFELLVRPFRVARSDLVDPDSLGHVLFEVRYQPVSIYSSCSHNELTVRELGWDLLLECLAASVTRSTDLDSMTVRADLVPRRLVVSRVRCSTHARHRAV